MKRSILGMAALIALIACQAWAKDAKVERDLVRRTLIHGGIERTYHVHYPKNQRPQIPRPIVFVLHGGDGADAKKMARQTGFNAIADRDGFIVVYPAGVNGQWNDGRGKTFRKPMGNTAVDDVGFISSTIDLFINSGEVDSNRIYVTGISNGGMMTHRIGIELGAKVAAIAPAIANIPVNLSNKRAIRPLPVLIMNGTDDPLVPWNGGPVRVFGKDCGEVLSTEQTVKYWVDAAKLTESQKKQLLADRYPDDKCRVEVNTYTMKGQQVEVVLYKMRGGGHNLPGGNTRNLPRLLGRKCMDINGPEIIWAFFAKHALAKPAAPAGTHN